jgi:hypothetical protein
MKLMRLLFFQMNKMKNLEGVKIIPTGNITHGRKQNITNGNFKDFDF